MKTTVIYFNQWFSSIGTIIKDMKSKLGDNIKIIGSSKNKYHAYKDDVDQFILEDWACSDSSKDFEQVYTNYVYDICLKYNVDIFFVRKYSSHISNQRKKFESIGVKLVLEDVGTFNYLNDKVLTYEKLKGTELSWLIPEYYAIGNSRRLLMNTTKTIKNGIDGKELFSKMVSISGFCGNVQYCLKKRIDEGGCSYRLIDNKTNLNYDSLSSYRVNKLSRAEAIELIDNLDQNEINRLFLMERLDKPEISVDCYMSKQGFIAICREKDGRVQKVYMNKIMTSICEKIASIFGIKYAFNVQFMAKKENGKNNVRLLEINTRLSGGSYYYTLLDINLAYLMLDDILDLNNYNINDLKLLGEKFVTHIEKPIII